MKPLAEMTELELAELVEQLKALAEARNIEHIFDPLTETLLFDIKENLTDIKENLTNIIADI